MSTLGRRLAAALFTLILAGCGGGGSGTGIATLSGNVIAAGTDQTPLSDIEVTVVGTSLQSRTDAAGAFTVRGEFAGTVTLAFERSADALAASLEVFVPQGGALRLDDIVLDAGSGTATPERQEIAFTGTVVSSDCAGGTLAVAEPGGAVLAVDLSSASLHGPDGDLVPCEAIPDGAEVFVQGELLPDGSIVEGDLTLRSSADGDGNGGNGGNGGNDGDDDEDDSDDGDSDDGDSDDGDSDDGDPDDGDSDDGDSDDGDPDDGDSDDGDPDDGDSDDGDSDDGDSDDGDSDDGDSDDGDPDDGDPDDGDSDDGDPDDDDSDDGDSDDGPDDDDDPEDPEGDDDSEDGEDPEGN